MDKCTCKPAIGILGVAIMAAGVYFLVWGFMTQTTSSISWSSWNWGAGLFYLIGLFLLCIGKMVKMKGCSCKLHHPM